MEPAEMEKILTSLQQHMERHRIDVLESEDIAFEDVFAKGGCGQVIKGTLKSDGSRVVVKQILDSHYDIIYVKMFAKETKILSTIKHKNIVSLRGVCIEPTRFSPIMELMEFNLEHPNIRGLSKGHNLAELLSILDHAALVEEIGVKQGMFHRAALDVVTGLAFLHHQDICHRDMKPSNILVTNTGDSFTFKLTDFGESRSPDIQTKSVPHENTDRVGRGTKPFKSPEQILKSLKKADITAFKRMDVWSCGMVLFCLLSPDFVSPWVMELKNQPNKDDVLKARIYAKQLPKGSDKYKHLADETGLGVIYRRCCHFDPESRPDIDVIQYELKNLTSNRMVAGRSVSPAAGEHGDGGARAMDVPTRQPSIGADGTLVDAADQPWDAAAYGGLRVTGVVGARAGPRRLQWPRGVSAHGDLVWVADRGSRRVVVFRRTTGGGRTAHRYVAEYPDLSPWCIAATDTDIWISQDNVQLQGVRLVGRELVLTRTLPATGRLTEPYGLAYRESNQTLYVCCQDGVHLVDVAGGGVVATLNTPPEVEGWRPRYVSVLQDTILVAYNCYLLVLYTGDGAPGRVLNLPGLSAPYDITHNGEHFVVCDWHGGSLHVVSREGEAVTRVRLEGEAVTRVRLGEVLPVFISWPPHHHLLYVKDWTNDKLFVVSR